MAKSRFEYVKDRYEKENYLLQDIYLVIRLDGRGFHKLSDYYEFEKPNDMRALTVMNEAAKAMVKSFPDVMMAYGDSDEYSFLLRRDCELFERREAKLVSTFASTFTAFYMQVWPNHFDKSLQMARLPTFDARVVQLPTKQSVRDVFSWRQADCHINNLYNTPFWHLVKSGKSATEAEQELSGTNSGDKNELLFTKFGINYNNEPEIYRKGTVIVREMELDDSPSDLSTAALSKRQVERLMKKNKIWIAQHHCDIIKDDFWDARPWLLL